MISFLRSCFFSGRYLGFQLGIKKITSFAEVNSTINCAWFGLNMSNGFWAESVVENHQSNILTISQFTKWVLIIFLNFQPFTMHYWPCQHFEISGHYQRLKILNYHLMNLVNLCSNLAHWFETRFQRQTVLPVS